MNRTLKCVVWFVPLIFSWSSAYPQGTATSSASGTGADAGSASEAPDCLGGAVKDIKNAFGQANKADAKRSAKRILQRWPVYICQFTADPIRPKLLSQAEQKRQDKQPGAASSSSGSTSLVSKGSSPWLLGFALEHGGLTQTTSGNTITFRGNVANSIRALMNGTYLGSYHLAENDALVQGFARLSFGVSFDTSSNQPSTSQGFTPSNNNLSGFSAKYEILNHRDPRDRRYRVQWNQLAGNQGVDLAGRIANLDQTITETYKTTFVQWNEPVFAAVDALPDDPSDEQIRKVVQDAADSFHQLFWDLPKVKDGVGYVTSSISSFLAEQDKTLSRIRGTPLVTIEYNLTRQLTTNNQNITATQPNQKIPSLSNINLVYEKGIQGGNTPEFTFNAGFTWFNSSDATTAKRGQVRDYQASLQLDVPLKEIQNLGRPTLSFSGQFLALLEEPLGQKVMLNGVTIDRRGNMGVFQTKLSVPVKDSGVKIPISFTYASRTELVKENDVRGNIGITFDLDTLFARPK